jgi:hypothetical protein
MTTVNGSSECLLIVTSPEDSRKSGTTTNTDFIVHLNNHWRLSNVTACSVKQIIIPNMFENVRAGLNTFVLTDSRTGVSTTLSISPGFYDISKLAAAVRELTIPMFVGVYIRDEYLTLAAWDGAYQGNPNNFPTDSNWQFTSPTADDPHDLLTSILGISNGFLLPINLYQPDASARLQAPLPYNTNPLQNVYVTSTALGESNAIGIANNIGTKIDQNVLEVVPICTTPRGQYHVHEPQDPLLTFNRFFHKKNLTVFDIQITDLYGRVLRLPSNFHVVIVLRLYIQLMNVYR